MSTETISRPSDAMLRRVQALLAKASDGAATSEESETYVAKATALMAKYGIEQAMLDAAKPAGQREEVTSKRIVIPGPYAMEKRTLLHVIAKPLGVRDIRIVGLGGKGEQVVHVFGYPSDLEKVDLLFASLTLQAIRDAMRVEIPYYEHRAAFRRTFLDGFARAVGRRLADLYRKTEQEASATAPGTALVLVDRRTAVQKAFEVEYPKVRSSSRNLSGGGYGAGVQAGQRADIGQRAAGGGRRQLQG